jgi:hypothetical protein
MSKHQSAGLTLLLSTVFIASTGWAQTPGSIAISGGTLSYDVTTSTGTVECSSPGGPITETYTTTTYNEFSFTGGGVTTKLGGETASAFLTGKSAGCSPPSLPSTAVLTLPNGGPSNLTVTENTGRAANITVSVGTSVDPYFKVVSILYTAPGNLSSASFTNTETNGTTTSVGSNFTTSVADTFSYGFVGASVGFTFGASTSTGNTHAFTESIADASSIADAGNSAGPNTVNHSQDLFLLWLNPEVTTAAAPYSLNTQYLNGAAEPVDTVEVFGSEMQPNSSGLTSITAAHLNKQYDRNTNAYTLPGVANVCASLHGSTAISKYVTEYANNSCSLADQCGCTPKDLAPIVAQDLFLNATPSRNGTTATSPYNFDSSGTLCSSPNASDNCRYVPVACSTASCNLAGPSEPGGNRPVNSFTQTDSSQTTLTFSESSSESLGYTLRAGLGTGPSVQSTTTWTWTDTQSLGEINGQANSLAFSLSSNTVGCSQDILVFEDTVFHTFVLQQAPNDSSCP